MISRTHPRLDSCLYAAYTLRSVATPAFRRDLNRAATHGERARTWLVADVFRAWLRHETSPGDYLAFEMWGLTDEERSRYVSTLQMYQYQRWANDRRARRIFRDKRQFRRVFSDYLLNDAIDLDASPDVDRWVDDRRPHTVAAKAPLDQAGRGVSIATLERTARGWQADDLPWQEFVSRSRLAGRTLLEEGLVQHPSLDRLNPSSINTVRIITRLRPDGSVQVVSAALRVGVGGRMDNFTAGGLTCSLDPETGLVRRPFRSKVRSPGDGSYIHPGSGLSVEGLVMPFWDDVLVMIGDAATRVPQVRTVGWDVVIGPDGPGLVEGNDNWDKTHWQKVEGAPMGGVVRAWWQEETGGVSSWALSRGKRVMDLILGGAAVLLLAPVAGATALLVRLRMGRPVLFVAERPGLHSVPFRLHKFRTMTDERDASGDLLPPVKRMTKLGRRLRVTSVDEIPELLDVLRGRMSLVGPRPLRMDYLVRYSSRQARRHLVKPGVTGLAQVSGRERLAWEQRFDLDVRYVATCSFTGDLGILWQTVKRLLADVEPAGGPLVTEFRAS